LCGGTESWSCFSAYDFDQSSESYEILRCKSCGLALTTPMPDPAIMDRYYPETYYGSGSKKFSSVIEFLTVLGCKLRARKIFKKVAKTRSLEGVSNVLDIGCGRANLLRFLKEPGCNCYGTERSKFPADSQLSGIQIFKGSVAEGDYEDEFYKLIQKRSGVGQTLKLMLWLIIAMLILPLAMIEFVISCMLGRSACAIVSRTKSDLLYKHWMGRNDESTIGTI
jgi:hypothetical protein